ncbi:hypothetical protein P5V15_014562 [Pogonomyrmex californicus]
MNSMIPDGTVSRSIEIGLRVIGVWPDSSYSILRRAFWMITLTMAQTFQYRYFVIHVRTDDLSHLMDGLSTTMSYSLLLLKLTIFWINRRLLNEIIASMSKDWKECDISNEYTMTRIAYVSRWVSNVIIFSHMMSVFLYATGTLLKIKSENQTNARELIIKMEIPFEIETTPQHVIVLVTQFIHQTTAAGMVGVLNSLLIILVLHICGQIDLMRQKLIEVTRKNIERKNVDQDVKSIVKALIVRHQQIITFSKNIENLYSNIALIQFFSNTLVICCLGFLIVISIGVPGGSMMLIKSVFFYIVMSLEAFIYCFVGEHLSTKSEMIGDAAYESLWYESSPSQNRDIHIMIIRSQKHLTLTIGKVAELSLRQFANIIKASASYVSVLHAMY